MLGPIVDRELMMLARRRACYGSRVVVPGVMLGIIGANLLGWWYFDGGPHTVQQAAWFGRLTFSQLATAQMVMTMQLVTEFIARTIAEEKDRKTLTFVLSTPLSSGSIVLGKLAAGLWQYLGCLFSGLPVVLLLPLFGGVQPELVLLTYAATISVAVFLAAVSLAISVASRRAREAHRIAVALVPIWIFGPFLTSVIGPMAVPRLYPWIRPLNDLVLSSTPAALVLAGSGIRPTGTFLEVFAWMVGLQAAGTVMFLLLAVFGLRPAWRRHDDGGRAGWLARLRARRRPPRRPPCGDRPILWKERHVEGARGIPWLVFRVLFLALSTILAVAMYYAARGAFAEFWAPGAGSLTGEWKGRIFLNEYLRIMTTVMGLVYAVTVTGIASESIAVERLRETWLGLIATPMDGREILRGKMIGSLWRSRAMGLVLVALWAVGLAGGSLHPAGFFAGVACLAAWSWLFTAIGTYSSLRAKTVANASNASLLPVLLLCVSGFLPKWLPETSRSILFGVGSFPLLGSLSLVSYPEVRDALTAPASPTLEAMGLATGEGTWLVLLTYAVGIGGAAGAALALTRLGERQFDRLVGRPYRPAPAVEPRGDRGGLDVPPVAAMAEGGL